MSIALRRGGLGFANFASIASIVSPGLLQARSLGHPRQITRATAASPNAYASDYSFIFAAETKR